MTTRSAALAPVEPIRAGLTPVQYAVLGLLHSHPAHGYELQRRFAAPGDLADVVPVEQPTLYAALKDLATRGLIEGTEVREGLRPPRMVYALTVPGDRLLSAWLRAPVARLRQVRLDFLLKLYFARGRGERAVRALVEAQVQACEQYLVALEARAVMLDADDFAALVAESRTTAARATLEWLRTVRARS
jgi:DNA-binding PadR family transcriptional regulator